MAFYQLCSSAPRTIDSSSSPPLPSRSPPLRQPSLFDLLATESLLQTTRPALKKLIQSLAGLPGGGGEFGRWARRWGDEVTLLLELGLHFYFLRKHGAGFAENFYGLSRVVDGDDAPLDASSNRGLSRASVIKSLLVIVLLPYARRKLAELYERLSRMNEDGELESVQGKQMIEAFLAAYPLVAICAQSSSFAYQLLYACGKSKFHDPFQHLLGGFYLTYAPPPPPRPVSSSSSSSSDSLVKSTLNGLLRISSRLLSNTFSVGLFFVQFFDVFDVEGRGGGEDGGVDSSFSSSIMDDYSHRILKRLDALIAPPKMTTTTMTGFLSNALGRPMSGVSMTEGLSSSYSIPFNPYGISPSSLHSSGHSPALSSSHYVPTLASLNAPLLDDGIDYDVSRRCPICRGQRQNETALSVSGFVFCHECISSYLKQYGICPVTKLPAKTNNLVRLYPGI